MGFGRDSSNRRRLADMSVPLPPPAWVKAREESDPDWDDTVVVPVLVDSEFEAQIFQRTRRNPTGGGPILDFAVGLQLRLRGSDEGWVDVERVDCADGGVHVDVYRPSGEVKDKDFDCVPADCQEDLDKGYRWAVSYIWDLDERLRGWG